ncbi:aquaporin AQPcic-like isoform X3 [Agrilus planipennis]|uniref:Aquaporin AQPcic-like isoform X3 n=1 Tax=Agrilus planipennis TaxID=224129 RepID=A0A7F5R3R4_AGRPL|nr:aquaporin AQPcic-like isoform X3 [Agrilus planipennis]
MLKLIENPFLSTVSKNEEEKPSVLVLFLAEVVGTAMLIFLGCMGCATGMVDMDVLPHWSGLNFGLTVMTVIQTVGHISGAHLNPQVSLGAVILGKLDILLFPVYLVGQTLGALAGFGLLWVLTPSDYHNELCITKLHTKLNVYQGLFVEVVITALLLMVCAAVWDHRNSRNTDSTPVRFGLFIALMSMVAGPYTGASMNSARSLAPAILTNSWSNHWIYWVGPTVGAVLGSGFYKIVFYQSIPII